MRRKKPIDDEYTFSESNSESNSEETNTGESGSEETGESYSEETENSKKNSSSSSGKLKPIETRVNRIRDFVKKHNLKTMINFESCDNGNDFRVVKETVNLKKLLHQMDTTIEYIKSGTTGHTFRLTSRTDPQVMYAMKVCAYPKEDECGGMKNSRRPENAELKMINLLSDFVFKTKTPHFILPLIACNVPISTFINVPPSLVDLKEEKNYSYQKFIRRYHKGYFEDLVSIFIGEWATCGDLLDYVRKNYQKMTLRDWRVIFFQILYTLASIHITYPSFRHNDMKPNNILVTKMDEEYEDDYFSYILKGDNVKFLIPNIGLQIKIWDFDFASIETVVENNKVNHYWTKKMNVSRERNQYYDMHYFFNTLICERFFPQFYEGGAPDEIIDFVHRIVPRKFRTIKKKEGCIRKGGRILYKGEITTPRKVLLTDPLFEKYRFPLSVNKKKSI